MEVKEDPANNKTTDNIFADILEFKTIMLVAYAFGWLVIEKLSINFFQQKDLKSKQEKPTLYLGQNVDEVIHKFQSNVLEDKEKIDTFIKETNFRVEAVRAPDRCRRNGSSGNIEPGGNDKNRQGPAKFRSGQP